LLERLEQRGVIVFGADVWASDWSRMSPNQKLSLVLGRIEANRGGIVVLHDTSVPIPKLASARGTSDANFGIKGTLPTL
jgi:hypothetical protein